MDREVPVGWVVKNVWCIEEKENVSGEKMWWIEKEEELFQGKERWIEETAGWVAGNREVDSRRLRMVTEKEENGGGKRKKMDRRRGRMVTGKERKRGMVVEG